MRILRRLAAMRIPKLIYLEMMNFRQSAKFFHEKWLIPILRPQSVPFLLLMVLARHLDQLETLAAAVVAKTASMLRTNCIPCQIYLGRVKWFQERYPPPLLLRYSLNLRTRVHCRCAFYAIYNLVRAKILLRA